MKYTNKLYMFLAACAIAMTACTDDMPQRPGTPVETGDAIMFASMLNGDLEEVNVNHPETRTHYGERTETGIPIRWDGGDQIALFCPQASAPADHLVTYAITPSDADSTKSGSMIKVDTETVGLQWGTAKVHKFFGVFPASVVKKAHQDDQAGIITATLPSEQRPKRWVEMTEHIPGKGDRKVYYGAPNMDYSLMLAYKSINKDTVTNQTPITLEFQNLVTVLDIVIQGPEKEGESVTITNINVDVVQGENVDICGDFNVSIQDLDENKIVCTPIESDKVKDRVSISCYNDATDKFITLQHNEVMVVKAFIIPDNQHVESFRQFRITVASLNGSANRITLNRADLGEDVKRVITPFKINRILLPHVTKGEPVNWMANLDDNIYLTELSVPGSKFSYSTAENGANPVYQTATIKEQFATGIRAFIVQTGAEAKYNVTQKWVGSSLSYTYEFLEASSLPVHKAKAGTTLENTLDVIREGLQEKKSECAFLILTCEASAVKCTYEKDPWWIGGIGDGVDGIRAWTESLKYKLNELKTKYSDIIYTNEITKETTLGDVRGKLIIKVNTNNQDQEKYFTPDDTYPALFAIWENPANHKDYYYSTVPLHWGTNNSKTTREPLNWMSAEVTHVGDKEEINDSLKRKSIKNVLRAAVKDYNTIGNQHNTFYMVDAGGEYRPGDNPTQDLAKNMNELVVEELQTRKENASTGLVFMNFADRGIKQPDGTYQGSGQLYKSDYIIASIIDNNFKFALRKRSSTPTPPLR